MDYIKHASYEEYKAKQTEVNKIKLQNIWVVPSNMKDIKNHCDKQGISVENIICHGTRNGAEIQFFNEVYPDAGIMGTEISDTATQFPNTIQWDFHDENLDWVGEFDIVYTNSWDHAYDFEKALGNWMKTLTENGRLFLDWNDDTSKAFSEADCCGCSKEELIELLNKNYEVETDFKIDNRHGKTAYMVVIKNK